MAIVATAASAPSVLAGDRRATLTFRWLVLVATLTVAAELVAQTVARAALPAGWMDEGLLGASVLSLALAIAAATVAWLLHRQSPELLLLATLAPIACA